VIHGIVLFVKIIGKDCKKKMDIWTANEYLVFGVTGNIDAEVNYTLSLDLSDYITSNQPSKIYDVYAVTAWAPEPEEVNVSFVKKGDVWYKMSDSSVTTVTEDRVTRFRPVLIFAKRR